MTKFDKATRVPRTTTPIVTTTPTPTAEGGSGFARDVKSELFLLAVSNFVRESAFYESAETRDDRFTALVHQATMQDPDWTARLIAWLRSAANMRSASLVAAAEYVKAGGPNGRAVVRSVLLRADEPGEMLAYWHLTHGRAVPKSVKRGVADALTVLLNERSALKYDGTSKSYRLGDVIELTHPKPGVRITESELLNEVGVKPSPVWQHDLFRWLLDRRRHDNPRIGENLSIIAARARLETVPAAERRALFDSWGDPAAVLGEAGATWEWLSGWLQGPMDKAAWEAVIPSMGYMARMRNLRNFDEAGVSDKVAKQVADFLADPEQVAKSRQLPLRFLSAYKNAPSLRWAWALEQAVGHSLANVPELPGRTLILVDLSGSMWDRLSAKSDLMRYEAAALFGFALGMRAQFSDVYTYGTNYSRVALPKAGSLLPTISGLPGMGGTTTWRTLSHTYADHDRVIILTDEQAHPGEAPGIKAPIVTFNLGGYSTAHVAATANRVTIGGLTDQAFGMLDLLDKRFQGRWPF